MVGSGPHQENPRQVDPQQIEPIGPQQQNNPPDPGPNLGNGRNREGSVHTTQTSQSHSQVGSRISQRQNNYQAMQREIAVHSKDGPFPAQTYSLMRKRMSVTGRDQELSQVKPFSYEKEQCPERRHKSPSSKGLGNDAMNKALDQISRLPFAHGIEGAKLPWRFHQPTFTIYNDRADPVEHVSQFNQRMAIHSQNEALMCKVFPSSLGPVVMRWFNSLKTNSIDSYK